jgi:hypothetical protein
MQILLETLSDVEFITLELQLLLLLYIVLMLVLPVVIRADLIVKHIVT